MMAAISLGGGEWDEPRSENAQGVLPNIWDLCSSHPQLRSLLVVITLPQNKSHSVKVLRREPILLHRDTWQVWRNF